MKVLQRIRRTVTGMLGWIWRGFVRRMGLATRVIPPPPHRRDPEVSEKFQVEPPEQHDPPPPPR